MTLTYIYILGGFIALSAVQYWGCRLYLTVANKITQPVGLKGNLVMGLSWALMSILILLVAISGIKILKAVDAHLLPVFGVAPMVIGFIISISKNKNDWKAFFEKFQKK